MNNDQLPELDSQRTENNIGAMCAWIALTLAVLAIVLWSMK